MKKSDIALALAAAVLAGSCASVPRQTPADLRGAESAPVFVGADDLSLRLSRAVLGGLRDDPELTRIRREGIVRFLLPPAEPPFQFARDPEGPLQGFSVDLAREIARLLTAKPNAALQGSEPKGFKPDFRIAERGAGPCDGRDALPVFYRREKKTWLLLCPAQATGGRLNEALANILDHLNETGAFRELYAARFEPEGSGPDE